MRKITRFLLLGLVLPFSTTFADTLANEPNRNLTPEQIVVIVVDALKHNDPSTGDNGINTVYNFASPGNKSSTGPIARFTQMIKGGFPDMLNHVDSSFSDIEVSDGTAVQAVWFTSRNGLEKGYVFQLGKQVGGEYDGMWMTEAVWPISAGNPRGKSI